MFEARSLLPVVTEIEQVPETIVFVTNRRVKIGEQNLIFCFFCIKVKEERQSYFNKSLFPEK
jgi:hypothetical protein